MRFSYGNGGIEMPSELVWQQHKGEWCTTLCAPDERSRELKHPNVTKAFSKISIECALYAPETNYAGRGTIPARICGACRALIVWRILFRSNLMMYDARIIWTDIICTRSTYRHDLQAVVLLRCYYENDWFHAS